MIICRYSVIDDYTEMNTRSSTKAQTVNYAASILASPTPMYNSTESTLTSSESTASFSTFSSPSVTTHPYVVGSYIPTTSTTTATMHIFPSNTYNNVANSNINSVSSSAVSSGTGGAGFTYSSSTSTSSGVASSTNGIGGISSITESTTTTTNATPTKPASRKGSVIFPSVKNKPSVVNTTFTTDILTLKDVKVSMNYYRNL